MLSKTTIRETAAQSAAPEIQKNGYGKLAEHLRQSDVYRQAGMIFASPAMILQQICMNALADNKVLVMPSPHLRDGFFLLKPFTVPFKQLSQVVSLGGISRYGTKLKSGELCRLSIDLVATDTLAIDRDGYMVGDGHGFLDLSLAILAAYGAVTAQTVIVAAVTEPQRVAEPLDHDPWDARVQGLVSADGFVMLESAGARSYAILWDRLTLDRIKRITPLWQLYQAREVVVPASPPTNTG